jgi:hypothetical protein
MKKIILFSVALVLFSPVAAKAECMIGKDALVPVMKHNAPAHKVRLTDGGQGMAETATLSDGTKITYTVGGCSHFAFAYKFENIPGGVPEKPDNPFALPLKLIAAIPYRDQFDGNILIKALKEKQASGNAAFDEEGKTDLPCGDAFCNLTIGKDSVTIDYDFAI